MADGCKDNCGGEEFSHKKRRGCLAEIDGKTLQPGIWYGVELEKRMVN